MNRSQITAIFLALAFILAGGMFGESIVSKAQAHLIRGDCNAFTDASASCLEATKIYRLTVNLTPVATAAAVGVSEQTFAVTGTPSSSQVFVSKSPQTALCPAVNARVSAVDTIAIQFATLTAAACTPASGVYQFLFIR